jgi:hypothetical protein
VHWLNANSGAIQALGSIASVLIHRLLAFITWKYVRLAVELEIHITWLTNLFSEIRSVPWSRNLRSVNQPLGSPTISNEYDWKDFPKRDYETRWRFAHGPLPEDFESTGYG